MKTQHLLTLLLVLPTIFTTILISDLSSKTIYDAVRGDIRNLKPLHNDHGKCTPQRIYMVLRHGSRNFGNSLTNRMEVFLDKLESLAKNNSIVLPPIMDWYKTWSRGVYHKDYELVPEGMMEHYTIADRYKTAFSQLFPEPYSTKNYSLQVTYKMRTIQSGLSFMDGLFHGTGPLESSESRLNITMGGYMPPGLRMTKNDEDKILRFIDCCPRYQKYIHTLAWKKETELFEETKTFKSAVDELSKSINFTLTKDDAKAIYYLCASEQMSPTQAKHSNFCSTFPSKALKVFDFNKDLEKYYKYSYPFETTYKMSCLLLQDIIKSFSTSENTPILKFAHEETIMPLFTLLDLFNDGQLLTHKMKDFVNRKMKISDITPFAGNIALIKHSCPGDVMSRVQMIVNEKEVETSWCSAPACTLPELQQIIAKRAENCDFDSICDVNSNSEYSVFYLGIAGLLTLCIVQATYIFFHCVKRCPMKGSSSKSGARMELLNSEMSEDLIEETELQAMSHSEVNR